MGGWCDPSLASLLGWHGLCIESRDSKKMNVTENLMKMKLTSHSKYLRKLYIASLSAAMLTVQVRHASAQTEQDMIEVARSVVAADRKAVVVAAMQLTEKEATSFWPLYDDYRNEM